MKQTIIEWVKTIIISIAVAFLITQFIKPTIVKEHSMVPTLNEYDYIILNKVAYIGDKSPEFGDIIVFKSELLTEDGKKKYLIKRVIGVGGDTITVADGDVYRNGVILEEPYINGDYTAGDIRELAVEEGKLFVMGDNRPNSMDSRDMVEVGQIDESRVLGKTFLRLYPFNQIGFIH